MTQVVQLLLILLVLVGVGAATLYVLWQYERHRRAKLEARLRQVLVDVAHLEAVLDVEKKGIDELHEDLVNRGVLSARSLFRPSL